MIPPSTAKPGMSKDLVELWDALGLEQVDLVGHSMGSVVALITAGADCRIRRLVVSGIGRYQLHYDGGPLPHFDSQGFAAALSVGDPSELTNRGMREFRDEVDEFGGDRRALAAHLRVFHTDPLPLDRIEAPTLVITGQDDELSPEAELLAGAIPRGQAMTLPGDHAGTKTTAAFIDAVQAFLNQRG